MPKSDQKKIAEACAKALFESYRHQNSIITEISKSFQKLEKIFKKHPELTEILKNPLFNKQEKTKIFDFLKVSKTIESYIQLLLQTYNIQYFLEIMKEYQTLFYAYKNILRAEVTVVNRSLIRSPLMKKLPQKIEAAFGKKTELFFKIDPSIYGGFIVKVGSYYMDASLKGQIVNFFKESEAF